jgi:hypothetical protein
MATRRRYKSPPAYKDGERVPVDNATAPPVEAAPTTATADVQKRAAADLSAVATATRDMQNAAAPTPPPLADDADQLVRAYRAQQRAEELQRNAARAPSAADRQPTIDEHIDAMPISDFKKKVLREHPHFLEPATAKEVAFHYQAALNQGIADDTPGMTEAILSGLKREREHAVEQARAVVEAPAPAAPRRPSVRVSAPVSREAPMPSGKRREDTTVTLTPEEVDMAHRSFVDHPDMPRMSNAEKEYSYWLQKKRYLAMKASGEYSEQK